VVNGGGQVSTETIRWAAQRTIQQHEEPASEDRRTGVCARCKPGAGCALLGWALTVVDAVPRGDVDQAAHLGGTEGTG
jgi:hypothetical protein